MPLVVLRNPRRELTIEGTKPVKVILRDLQIDPDTVLVIRGDELLTREDVVGRDERIEIRPVISGGSGGRQRMKGSASKGRVAKDGNNRPK